MDEKVKKLFIKHFGFYPDIISTTEHAYISPPSRVISSLKNLSRFQKKQVLRIILTDKFSIHPESCVKQICLPHLLNKNTFVIDDSLGTKEFTEKFNDDIDKVNSILHSQPVFSNAEKENYKNLISLYQEVLQSSNSNDRVLIYAGIIKMFVEETELIDLDEWLKESRFFGIDSTNVRAFLKDSFILLSKNNLIEVDIFGLYLEKNKRLKCKGGDGVTQVITWGTYLSYLQNSSISIFIPFEIILFVYGYCGGSHYGNDYGLVKDINEIHKNNNILQMTEHNRDFSFTTEETDIKFQKATYSKDIWNLSHHMTKNVDTLSELYIVLGREKLKHKLQRF